MARSNPLIDLLSQLKELRLHSITNRATFFEAAEFHLASFPLVTYETIVEMIAGLDEVPEISCNVTWTGFGEPRVIISSDIGFELNILFWFDNITSIHDHYTDVVSKRLAGNALETVYAFEQSEEPLNTKMVGVLRPLSIKLDRPGDLKTVPAGAAVIHQVIPIVRPTISLLAIKRDQPKQQMDYVGRLAFPSLRNVTQSERIASAAVGALEAGSLISTDRNIRSVLDRFDVFTLTAAALQLLFFHRFRFSRNGFLSYLERREPTIAAEVWRAQEISEETTKFLTFRQIRHDSISRLYLAIGHMLAIAENNWLMRPDLFNDTVVCKWIDTLSQHAERERP